MAKAAQKQELEVKKPMSSTSIVQVSDDLAQEFQGVEGAGVSANVEDRGTPLLYIAQKGSPQVDRNAAEFIQGLEVGMAFVNLTGEFYPDAEEEGVPFLPCFHRANWVEWLPRSGGGGGGGGFQGSHPYIPRNELAQQFEGAVPRRDEATGKERNDIFRLPNGHDLVLTQHYFGILADKLQPVIVPMSSSNLKASTTMQALLSSSRMQHQGRLVTPPAYILPWRLRTVYATNDAGAWYRWAPQRLGNLSDPDTYTSPELRSICREFALACQRNEVQMAKPLEPVEGASAGTADVPI